MTEESKRQVPMQVLVLSPPRTATLAMSMALTKLPDAPVYHGHLLMSDRTMPPKFWLKAVEAKYENKGEPYTRSDFEVYLHQFAGVTDMPACWFWGELMDAYPEAKVLLVHRDMETWLPSFNAAVISGGVFTILSTVIRYMEPMLGVYPATQCQKQLLGVFGVEHSRDIMPKARDVIERHYTDIREKCAETPGRLVEMRIEEGWEPLCKLLEKDVPEEPFPRANELKSQKAKNDAYRRLQVRNAIIKVVKFGSVVAAVAAAWWYNKQVV